MRRWAIVLVVVAVAVPGVVWMREFVAVDRCLDRGGVFDFSAGQCTFSVTHGHYISFSSRHRPLMVAAGAVGVVGIALLIRSKRQAAVA